MGTKMGCRKSKEFKMYQWPRRREDGKRQGLRRVSKETKKGRLKSILPLAKRFLQEEYKAEGFDHEQVMWADLEHVFGHKGSFQGIPAEVSLRNLRLVPRHLHNLKTDGQMISKNYDFATTGIQERIKRWTERMEQDLGMLPTPKEIEKWYRKQLRRA